MSKIKAYYFFIAGAVLLAVGYFLTVREIRAEYEPEPEYIDEPEQTDEPEPQPRTSRRKKEPKPEPQPDNVTIQDAVIITPDETKA
jgi:hypothetical protein